MQLFGHQELSKHHVSNRQSNALQLLGTYGGAARRLLRAKGLYRVRGIKSKARYVCSFYLSFNYMLVLQLPNPEPRCVQVNSSALDALLYRIDKAHVGKSANLEQVRVIHTRASPGICPNSKIDIQCVQHSKITVCLPLLQYDVHTVYIGASDFSCCQWCDDGARLPSTEPITITRVGHTPKDG
jgi:hypothetical protein